MCRSHTSGRHQLCRMLLQWDDDSKVMMIHSGTTLPPPTHPTKDNAHLDIFSNIRFSPKLCRWALNRKTWRDSGELWSKTICCILWYWTNSLTIWRAVQAWMKTTTSIVFFRPMRMLGDPNYNTVVRNKLKLRGASAGLSMKMEQFFQWTIVRSCPLEQPWRRKADPFATRWLPSWWAHGLTRDSFVISWGSSMLAIRQESTKNRGEGWNNGSVINLWLKKSLISKKMRCRLMKVACWVYTVRSTRSFLRM